MIIKHKIDATHSTYYKDGVKISEEEANEIGGIIDYKDSDEGKAKAAAQEVFDRVTGPRQKAYAEKDWGEQLGMVYHLLKGLAPKDPWVKWQDKIREDIPE